MQGFKQAPRKVQRLSLLGVGYLAETEDNLTLKYKNLK